MKIGEQKTFITGRRIIAVLAAVVIVGAGGGMAYAYWSSTGDAAGSATTGTSTAFVVTTLPATGAPLTPGGPAQSVAFTVANPSTGSQNLSSVVATVANSDGSPWTAVTGCSAADYSVGTPDIVLGQIAPGGSVAGTVAVSMNNLSSNQDACKGVTVLLYIVAS
jgi:hypothetical protein